MFCNKLYMMMSSIKSTSSSISTGTSMTNNVSTSVAPNNNTSSVSTLNTNGARNVATTRNRVGTRNGGYQNSSSRNTTTTNNNSTTQEQQQQQQQQQQFYPKLITAQIVALQCFHYSVMSVLFQVNHVLYGTSITIDRIFTDQYMHTSLQSGWADSLAIIISYTVGSYLLAIIVEKSKKCLDFACTLLLVHLFICIIYNYGHIPYRSDWWIVNITGTIIMIVLGEFLCSRRELDDIPLLQL